MNNEPILASRVIKRSYNKWDSVFTVYGGLHYIKGNSAPYFSLTCWEHRKGFPSQDEGGGADHESILKFFPRFADLAALHLSDIDGAPMHAIENGFYWLAGAGDGFGQRYHGGSGSDAKTPDQCLRIFADQCRVSMEEARQILETVSKAENKKEALTSIMDAMRPRWKAEAEACIEKHGLRIYGDPWPKAV